MAEWIDEIVNKMTADQRRRVDDERTMTRIAEFIENRGPAFFEQGKISAAVLVGELSEKLGKDAASIRHDHDTAFTVTGKTQIRKVRVTFILDTKGQQIKIERKLEGVGYLGDGSVTYYPLQQSKEGLQAVDRQDHSKIYRDFSDLVDVVLRETYTSLFQ